MNKNIKKQLLTKIKREEIKMKPKWWFATINKTEKVVVILFLISGAIMIGTAIYVIGLINPIELLDYGRVGIEVMMEKISFPMLLVGIMFGIIGGMVFSKSGSNYKKTGGKTSLIISTTLIVLVILLTMARMILEL